MSTPLPNDWDPTVSPVSPSFTAELTHGHGADSTSPVSRPTSGLRALHKVVVQPHWRSQVPNVSPPLLKIRKIQVVRSPSQASNDPTYTVKIYESEPKSRIPTSQAILVKSTPRDNPRSLPTLRVDRSVRQFSALRDSLHSCVQSSCQGCACDFCSQLSGFLTFGRAHLMAFARLAFDPEGDASELFEMLLEHLLDQCQCVLEATYRGVCRGQRHIPYLLYVFLHSPQE